MSPPTHPFPAPGEPRAFRTPDFTGTELTSGLVLRAARWGQRPTVAVFVLFPRAGSLSDPHGREGLAEIVADTLLSGSVARDARTLGEAIDDLAAVVDVSAGSDAAAVRLFLLEEDLAAGLDLLAEILTQPTFPAEEVEKSRRRHIDLLAEQRSEPDFLARERLLHQLYPGHPYGQLAATEAGLRALTREEVVSFHRRLYSLRGATVILVGSSAPDVLLRHAERALGPAAFGECRPSGSGDPDAAAPEAPFPGPSGLNAAAAGSEPVEAIAPAPTPPTISGFSVHLVNRPGAVQTNLLYARPAVPRRDPVFPSAALANQALGGGPASRLFHVLREEKGLTYGAYSSLSPRVLAGHFSASLDCRSEATDEALTGLLGLVREFAEHGPEEDEHQRAQDFLTGSFVLGRETPGAIAQDELTRIQHALSPDEWRTWRDRLRSRTRRDAALAARQLFHPEVGVLAAVGDASLIRATLERFGETTLWDADGPRR